MDPHHRHSESRSRSRSRSLERRDQLRRHREDEENTSSHRRSESPRGQEEVGPTDRFAAIPVEILHKIVMVHPSAWAGAAGVNKIWKSVVDRIRPKCDREYILRANRAEEERLAGELIEFLNPNEDPSEAYLRLCAAAEFADDEVEDPMLEADELAGLDGLFKSLREDQQLKRQVVRWTREDFMRLLTDPTFPPSL